jgi:hypothetical protein
MEVKNMQKQFGLFLIVLFLAFSASAVQAATLVQVFPCTINEGYTKDDLATYIGEYLEAARSIKGAEELEIYINVSVAPQSESIEVVAIFPSFAAWGHFTDDHPASPVEDFVAGANKDGKFSCSGGDIWASFQVD